MTDLASISPLVVVGARRVNGGGCRGVGQDVDEVWIHHVVVKQVKDAHSIRSICKEKTHASELTVWFMIQPLSLNIMKWCLSFKAYQGLWDWSWCRWALKCWCWPAPWLRWGTPGCVCTTCPEVCSAAMFACWVWCCDQTLNPLTQNLTRWRKICSQLENLQTSVGSRLQSLNNHGTIFFYLAWWQRNPGAPLQPDRH